MSGRAARAILVSVVRVISRVVGQVSWRDVVAAIESIHLYGSVGATPADGEGVDSAMRLARSRR